MQGHAFSFSGCLPAKLLLLDLTKLHDIVLAEYCPAFSARLNRSSAHARSCLGPWGTGRPHTQCTTLKCIERACAPVHEQYAHGVGALAWPTKGQHH